MHCRLVAAVCLVRILCLASLADAAAVLIPDHLQRLGTCGPSGPACIWPCTSAGGVCQASGPTCAAPGTTCALDAIAAFRGIVTVKIDDSACTANGAVMTIGLAGTANGMAFQIADKVIDLCDRSMECTGRDLRDCSGCAAVCTDQCTDDTDCDCPPGPVVFMCKDPFFDAVDPYLREDNLPFIVNWLAGIGGTQTHQPIMELIRNDLATVLPGQTGRPVIVEARTQSTDTASAAPVGRFCVKVWYLRDDHPLGQCADDPSDFCNVDADCTTGLCRTWTPAGVNPTQFTTTASGKRCSGNGKPCVASGDCPVPQTCDATTASADTGGACSESGTPCTSNAQCPQFESCVLCPTSPCGDSQLDPGEQCDDGNGAAGDGCSDTCQLEGCPAAPNPACLGGFAEGVLSVSEKATGREKLTARILDGPLLAGPAFGNPVGGATAYRLCVYDGAGALAGDLLVDRAGDACGAVPCWSGLGKPGGTKGWRYKDEALTADGVKLLLLRAGKPGRSKIILREKGPTGIAGALSGASAATLQVFASDAPAPGCFSLDLPAVITNDGVRFKAKTP
jgi:cysteine-rich repeat protein